MGDANAIIDIVKYVAWPIVVSGIAIGFRCQIGSFLSSFSGIADRIKKAGPLEFSTISDQTKPRENTKAKEETQEALGAEPQADDQSLGPWIDYVNGLISQNNLKDAPDLQERLVWTLAWNLRHNDFNGIAKIIFGTQIAALREITNSGGLTAEALRTFHTLHEEKVYKEGQNTPLDFWNWIALLRNQQLVVMDERGRYAITPIGLSFLKFAAADNVTEAQLF